MALEKEEEIQDVAALQDNGGGKKRKRDRRNALRKTQICYQYQKNGTCSYENCKFAHGSQDLVDGGKFTLSAQRELVRSQSEKRQAMPFHATSSLVAVEGNQPIKEISNNQEIEEQQPFISPKTTKHGSMIDRYYTRMYHRGNDNEDHYVHMHSNRLCIVGLAPRHPILTEQLIVKQVDFSVGKDGANLLNNKVKGKKKKGGMWLNPHTPLCRLVCTNDREFIIRSCIRGTLLELNEQLLRNPSLISTHSETSGYIAILRPKLTEIIEIQEQLETKTSYLKKDNLFQTMTEL